MRAKAAAHINKNDGIKWRSHEPSRIETFSDAAFAFALTLIIVTLDPPKTFDGLVETMNLKNLLSFAICFLILLNIWNGQNLFFRRYGLSDNYIIALNATLLFVVLVYTYPLKFLFELVFAPQKEQNLMIRNEQIRPLMLVYSAGFIAIYILFYLMYRHAQKFAAALELTPTELYATKTAAGMNLICMGISLVAATLAIVLPENYCASSAYLYCLFGPAYYIWFRYRGKKGRQKFPVM